MPAAGLVIKSLSNSNVNKIRWGNYRHTCLTDICIKHMLRGASLACGWSILLNSKSLSFTLILKQTEAH